MPCLRLGTSLPTLATLDSTETFVDRSDGTGRATGRTVDKIKTADRVAGEGGGRGAAHRTRYVLANVLPQQRLDFLRNILTL